MWTALKDGTSFILFQLYQVTGNLGLAIVALTLLVRFGLFPLTIKALNSQKKIQKLQPELAKLKQLHSKDKAKLQQAQMELYKKYNINPLAGCLPYLVQIVLLILLYQVLISFIGQTTVSGVDINPRFLWLDLREPDPFFILPVLAGLTQLVLSLMIAPGAEQPDLISNESKKKNVQEANKKEEDVAEMAQTMQKQMLFIMPMMTTFLAWKFDSGLALYWVATTLFSIGQQYYVSGWGGLVTYWNRARLLLLKRKK